MKVENRVLQTNRPYTHKQTDMTTSDKHDIQTNKQTYMYRLTNKCYRLYGNTTNRLADDLE